MGSEMCIRDSPGIRTRGVVEMNLRNRRKNQQHKSCLLYTSDAADDSLRVDLGGRRIIKKKKKKKIIINFFFFSSRRLHTIFFFFKQKTAYEIGVRLVGSEMCIRDSDQVSLEFAGSRVPPELMRLLPDKEIMVGVISVVKDHIETAEEVENNIIQALDHVDAERLIPCTNCGMAPISMDVAKQKLKALGEGSQRAERKIS